MATNNEINNTVAENDFSVNRSTAGTAVESSVEHSDNSNTGSHAQLLAQTGGGSGGDPFIRLNISGAQDYSFGIDNSNSDILKIQDDADPSTGNNLWALTSSGERVMPLQPCFHAYLDTTASNVTGNGTTYSIIFNNELIDQGSDFNTGTGTFTCPVDGNYNFGSGVNARACAAGMTLGECDIVTSDNTFTNTKTPAKEFIAANGDVMFQASTKTPMDAADTAYMDITITGGALVVDIVGLNYETYFYGKLDY